jgi:ribonucleoside-diphosphate reductase alpha chain
LAGWQEGLELETWKERARIIMDEMFEVTGEMLRKRPEMLDDGHKRRADHPVCCTQYSHLH